MTSLTYVCASRSDGEQCERPPVRNRGRPCIPKLPTRQVQGRSQLTMRLRKLSAFKHPRRHMLISDMIGALSAIAWCGEPFRTDHGIDERETSWRAELQEDWGRCEQPCTRDYRVRKWPETAFLMPKFRSKGRINAIILERTQPRTGFRQSALEHGQSATFKLDSCGSTSHCYCTTCSSKRTSDSYTHFMNPQAHSSPTQVCY